MNGLGNPLKFNRTEEVVRGADPDIVFTPDFLWSNGSESKQIT